MSAKLSRMTAADEAVDESPRSAETYPNDFTRSQVGTGAIRVRLIALFPVIMALGMLACTSEETPTEPAGSPSQAKAAVGTYVGLDLGTLGAPFQCCSEAFDINPVGQVVGRSTTANDVEHAFLWTKGVMTDLGTLGGDYSQANGINPSGQVVGASGTAGGQSHAFLWAKGVMTDLGTLGGNTSSAAAAINPAGQVVGYGWIASFEARHAFLWTNGVMRDLGTLGGTFSEATDINPRGQVVGTSSTGELAGVSEVYHAFLWENGVMTDLGTLGGSFSVATGINARGQVVGWSQPEVSERHAFLWENGVMTDLGTLASIGPVYSSANDINPAGQVVGGGDQSDRPHAVLWDKGVILDLTPDLSGSSDAAAINPAGQVVGTIEYTVGEPHAMLWTRR